MAYEEDKQSALTRALIMAGAAMTQPGPGGFMASLGRGGMMGLNAYDNTFEEMNRRRLQEEALKRSALEDKLKEIALARQEAVAKIMGGDYSPARPAGMAGPAMADAPDWKSSPMNAGSSAAAPSVRAQAATAMDPSAELRAKADALARFGAIPEAKTLQEYLKASEEEFSPDVRYDQNGRAFLTSKRGGKKYLDGIKARDELVLTDIGPKKVAHTKYDLTPRGEYILGMSPSEKAANAVAWANYYKPELRESGTGVVATSPDGKGGVRVMPTGIPAKAEKPPAEYDKQIGGVTNLRSAIVEYKDAMKNWGIKGNVSPDARAKLGTYYNNMMLQAKEAYNLGVLNGPDYAILTSIVTDPTTWKGAFTSDSVMIEQANALDKLAKSIGEGAARAHRQPVPDTAPRRAGPGGSSAAGGLDLSRMSLKQQQQLLDELIKDVSGKK